MIVEKATEKLFDAKQFFKPVAHVVKMEAKKVIEVILKRENELEGSISPPRM